jgi:GxxExxY protein
MNNDPQTYAIIGAAIEVHTQLGHGFAEVVYQDALALEFAARQIPFTVQVPLCIRYKGQLLACTYKVDFVCFGQVLVHAPAGFSFMSCPQISPKTQILRRSTQYLSAHFPSAQSA